MRGIYMPYLRGAAARGAWPGSCTETDATLPGRGKRNGKKHIGSGNLSGSHNGFGCCECSAESWLSDYGHLGPVLRQPGLKGFRARGAAAGALVFAALAWFVSTRSFPVPAFAPLVAAGPVLAALAGAGAGGALGWIVGLLAGLRVTEYVARRYAGRIRRGGILLSVHCDSPEWCERAKKTLHDTGARSISSAPEAAADYGTADKPTERAPVTVAAFDRESPRQPVEQVVHESRK